MNDIKNITEEINIIQDWNKDKSLSCFFLFSNSFNINNFYNISKNNLINMEAILNVLNNTILFDMTNNNDEDNAYILARLNENREWISQNFKQSLFYYYLNLLLIKFRISALIYGT